MKSIFKFISLISIVALLASCTKTTRHSASNFIGEEVNTNSNGQYAMRGTPEEETFREIFFLQGGSAEEVPYLEEMRKEKERFFSANPDVEVEWNNLTNELIFIIRRDYPTFFASFNNWIRSDDLYIVKMALDSSSTILQRAQYASETYRNMFVIGEFMIQDEHLKQEILSLDLETQEGRLRFEDIINNNDDIVSVLLPCTPVYAFCVAHSFAAISATALAAANVAAYATIIAKTAMFLWDKVKIWGRMASNHYSVDEVLVEQIARVY